MQSFQHIAPALRLYCGPDSLASLAHELVRLKSLRSVVVCGAWARGPMLDAVLDACGERCVGVFDAVVAHSPVESVRAAADLLRAKDADSAIALGGGSSIVTARAASILAAEQGSLRSLCTTREPDGRLNSPKLLAPKIPQLVIPTTPTTAMVKAGSAVFDPGTGERLPLYDPKTRAQSVFIDPEMISSSPRELVVSASLNTFTMAVEGLVSRVSQPMADALLMHVLRLVANGVTSPELGTNPSVRTDLVLAAVMCGQGTDHTAAGVTTVLGHALGARHGVENGLLNGIVLPYALRYNGTAGMPGLRKAAAALGLPDSEGDRVVDALIDRVQALVEHLSVPRRLRDVGVSQDSLEPVAAIAMHDWFLRGNPRQVQQPSELLDILRAAW